MKEASAALKEEAAPASTRETTADGDEATELVEPSVNADAMQQLQDMGFPKNRRCFCPRAYCVALPLHMHATKHHDG